MDRKLTPSPSACWCWYYCNSLMLELYCVVQVASEEEMHICLPAGMNVVCMQRSEWNVEYCTGNTSKYKTVVYQIYFNMSLLG